MSTPNQPGYEPDFMEEGGKSFSFDGQPPIRVRGKVRVNDPVRMQQRDFDDGTPLTWPDGNPKWQYRVDLQTDLREAPDDDGMRSIYLKYKSKAAVVGAVKASGAKRMEWDGDLELIYTSDDHSQPHRSTPTCTTQCRPGKGYPVKNWQAQYAPPAGDWMAPEGGAVQDGWAGINAAQQQQREYTQDRMASPGPPSGGQQGWQAPSPYMGTPPPAPTTAPAGLPPDLRAFLVGCGLPEARVDAMTEAQARQIAATFQ